MASFLRVRSLSKYQHYRDRNPPWVKLHRDLLEDYDFEQLPDATKAHAMLMLLLAARLGNEIPNDPDWIARKIGARSKVDVAKLLESRFLETYDAECSQLASKALASREQHALLEGEGEGEERQRRGTLSIVGSAEPTAPAKSEVEWRIERVWEAHVKQWRGFFQEDSGIKPSKEPTLTKEIRDAIKIAMREYDSAYMTPDTREEFIRHSKTRAAGIGIFFDTFMVGRHKDNNVNDGGKRYLEHWRPWKQQRGKGSPVDKFAELYFQVKDSHAQSRA